MKHSLWKYALRMGVLVCVLSCLLAVSALAGEERWGYQQLEDDAQQAVYQILVKGIEDKDRIIDFGKDLGLQQEDMEEVTTMLRADYPEFFWFDGQYKMYGTMRGGAFYCTKVRPSYVHDSNRSQRVFEHKVEQIIRGMENTLGENATDYEKVQYLHDALAQRVVYDLSVMEEQTAYSAIVEGRAVCAGYARAYQYLLNEAGIPAWTVEGWSAQPGSSDLIGHAWNLVWLDGKCVYTDGTWDDGDGDLYHFYLNRTLEEMNGSHIVDPIFCSVLPDCEDHCGMDYFTCANTAGVIKVSDDTTAAEMAEKVRLLQKGDAVHYLWDIWYTGSDFRAWLLRDADESGYNDILEALEARGSFGIAYSGLGGEIQLEIYPAGDDLMGWPELELEYPDDDEFDDNLHDQEGDYTIKKGELHADVSYENALTESNEYTVWIGYYTDEGALVAAEITTLELDDTCHGDIEVPCPETFDYCRVFVVGEASSTQISPLCAALDLAKK